MRLLLDTHIFLWSLLEPERLTATVARSLEDTANEVWLSPITTWECLLLADRGRIALRPEPVTWIREQYKKLRPKEAPINHEVSIQSRAIDLPHQDPADRFLAATALVYDLVLVTADERLLGSESFATLPNR